MKIWILIHDQDLAVRLDMANKTNWEIEPEWQSSGIADMVDSFDKAFEVYHDEVTFGRLSRVFRLNTNGEMFYLKQYFTTPRLSAWLGYSRCEVEVRNIKWFMRQGIACGQLVAHGIEKKHFRVQRGALITANVENTRDLKETAETSHELFRNRSWRRNIINQVADITRRLHSLNFCHNDFQWRNILVRQDRHAPQIFLIDCPFGRKFSWPLLSYRKIKDLGSLDEQASKHLSKTDRLRFYKRYQAIDRLAEADKKKIRTMLARYGQHIN